MVFSNQIQPVSYLISEDVANSTTSFAENSTTPKDSRSTSKEVTDIESISTVNFEESSYLKLKPFVKIDPTLGRLLVFLNCFGLTVNHVEPKRSVSAGRWTSKYSKYIKLTFMLAVVVLSGEVVYDVNLRQSKLLAEQKRSTPLLTFVIIAYSWLTVMIPVICDLSLLYIGSHLFRFHSRTTATVCNGMFFGKRTSVDSWYYYLLLVLLALFDAMSQVVVLGVWPPSIDPYMRIVLLQEKTPSSFVMTTYDINSPPSLNETASRFIDQEEFNNSPTTNRKIRAYLLDSLLGEEHAHSDLGVCLKILCLMIQFIHSYALLLIIISLANHYATAINTINENLQNYGFRDLLKQLIVLRDSSEQISLMISIPFAFIIILVFMRQIALNGVFIQSSMLPFENWAVSSQSITCGVSIIMVFIYCDGLQSASRQTHRLKTEQTVINDNRGGNQSIYEFLDYLNRLSKSIRITFFNIIAINKSSLVGLYGHILTLTFVTS